MLLCSIYLSVLSIVSPGMSGLWGDDFDLGREKSGLC
jgi:hypothetical protein